NSCNLPPGTYMARFAAGCNRLCDCHRRSAALRPVAATCTTYGTQQIRNVDSQNRGCQFSELSSPTDCALPSVAAARNWCDCNHVRSCSSAGSLRRFHFALFPIHQIHLNPNEQVGYLGIGRLRKCDLELYPKSGYRYRNSYGCLLPGSVG